MAYEPPDPNWRTRVEREFAAQGFMNTLRAELETIEPGRVTVAVAHDTGLSQQNGYLHGGVVGALLDNASGFAAMTLLPVDNIVLTVEYKANFLRPAEGDRFLSTGEVVKAGRTLMVCEAKVVAAARPEARIATALATMISLEDGETAARLRG